MVKDSEASVRLRHEGKGEVNPGQPAKKDGGG